MRHCDVTPVFLGLFFLMNQLLTFTQVFQSLIFLQWTKQTLVHVSFYQILAYIWMEALLKSPGLGPPTQGSVDTFYL